MKNLICHRNPLNCILLTSKDLELIVEKLSVKKSLLQWKFYQTCEEQEEPFLFSKITQNIQCQVTHLSSSQEASKTPKAKPNHREKTATQHLRTKAPYKYMPTRPDGLLHGLHGTSSRNAKVTLTQHSTTSVLHSSNRTKG